MHDCDRCYMACACDLEDHYQPAPFDCRHECEEASYDDDEWPESDDEEFPLVDRKTEASGGEG